MTNSKAINFFRLVALDEKLIGNAYFLRLQFPYCVTNKGKGILEKYRALIGHRKPFEPPLTLA